MKLLMVEDDAKLGGAIKKLLELEGYCTDWAQDGKEALEYVEAAKLDTYDVIILDWMLPEINGIDLCKILRNERKCNYQGGIIFVTAKDSTEDCVRGLDSGADDYVVKPFQIKELISRLNAVNRRKAKPFVDDVYIKSSIVIDNNLNLVSYADQQLRLSRKEFDLFRLLFINQNQILPRETIFEKVWRDKLDTSSASLDSHIYALRKKLKQLTDKISIRMVKGVGYILEVKKDD